MIQLSILMNSKRRMTNEISCKKIKLMAKEYYFLLDKHESTGLSHDEITRFFELLGVVCDNDITRMDL